MVALQIRDVPDEVRDILTDRARASGRSLQSYLLALVTSEAERARNVALLARFEDRADGTQDTMEETVNHLRAARADRGPTT